MRRRTVVLATVALLTGCGVAGGQPDEPGPITARAVAAVALEHLPDGTSSRRATYLDRTDPEGYVGAELRYAADPDRVGVLVRVTVTPDQPAETCAEVEPRPCARLGGGDLLLWDEAGAEEPGSVSVVTERDGARVAALLAGPPISRDPRRLTDLPVPLATLRSVVDDERLAPRASARTIAAGTALEDWGGGERGDGELDGVAQTSAGLVGTFMLGRGERWTYEGPSPVTDDLGPGAVGGRLRLESVDGPIGPGVLDVAAVPEMPTWAEPGTCRVGWRCWPQGDTRVVWRPARGADPGESWLLQPSADLGGVAALHTRGRRIPDDGRQIRYFSGYVLYARFLTDAVEPQAIGTTTDRGGLEQAEDLAAEHEK